MTAASKIGLANEGHNLPYRSKCKEASFGDMMKAHPRPAPHRAIAGRQAPQRFTAELGLLWLVLLGALLFFATNAHGALYKWSDDRGVVHYSDKMPADAVNRASAELSRQGLTVRKTEQASPVAQRALPRNDNEEQLARQAERARVLAARRDRALIESYTSESEIDLAKKRSLATIDGQVQSAQAFIGQMQKRRAELDAKQSTFAPRPVPGDIKREIENIDAEIVRQTNFIVAKQNEAATVAARYESDKQRFRELRSGDASSGVVASTTDIQLTSGPAKP